MLTIRLSRVGRNNQYAFRIVLQEHRSPVKGKALEVLGSYQPAVKAKPFVVKKDRIEHWISVGAQPSDTMATLLKREGFSGMEKFIVPRNRKRKKKGEEAAAPSAPAGAPAAKEEAKKEEAPAA